MTETVVTRHASLVTSGVRPLVVVVGPTAVGKSRLAVPLARALGTEILTADSRQVYRGMDIGTDKPTLAEQAGVPHRLIDLVDPDERFNVGLYRRLALAEIDRLHRDGQVPLVVGGTGLYVRALLRGLWSGPSADWPYRARLEDEAARRGPDYLHRELVRVDPESATRLHPRDKAKIIRALEVYHLLGRPLSEVHRRHAFVEVPFSGCMIGLTRDRSELYGRIEARVEEELAKGLVEETRRLLGQGYGRELGSMKGLGYRQMAEYLAGEVDYAEAVRRLKRDTRRFAKRQLTWFRQEPGIIWLTIGKDEPPEQVVARILDQVDRVLSQLEPGQEAETRTVSRLNANG
jgi:tRNA dimethylallyltransferase